MNQLTIRPARTESGSTSNTCTEPPAAPMSRGGGAARGRLRKDRAPVRRFGGSRRGIRLRQEPMQTAPRITFHGLAPSDALRDLIEERIAMLERQHPRVTTCRVTVALPHHRHTKGNHWHVTIAVAVPEGDEIVVNHGRSANATATRARPSETRSMPPAAAPGPRPPGVRTDQTPRGPAERAGSRGSCRSRVPGDHGRPTAVLPRERRSRRSVRGRRGRGHGRVSSRKTASKVPRPAQSASNPQT